MKRTCLSCNRTFDDVPNIITFCPKCGRTKWSAKGKSTDSYPAGSIGDVAITTKAELCDTGVLTP